VSALATRIACHGPAPALANSGGPFPDMAGRRMVVDHQGIMSPLAHRGDVLDVDFDAHSYQGEGIYLMEVQLGDELTAAGWNRWTGARRLMRQADGLHIRETVRTGGWTWQPWPQAQQARTRIFGRVHDVYRRDTCDNRPGVNILGRLVALGGEHGNGRVDIAAGDGRTITITGLESYQVHQLAKLLMEPVAFEITVCAETRYGPGAY
jgi:hypothetical protein